MRELNMHPTWSFVRINATYTNRIPSGGVSYAPFRHFVCSKNHCIWSGSYSVGYIKAGTGREVRAKPLIALWVLNCMHVCVDIGFLCILVSLSLFAFGRFVLVAVAFAGQIHMI